ncbi:ATP-binding protein [Spirosoma telluris]|uniref:ATP-binding protein n=1 Tax=Spirosoma telluris TaxID=2183553 RepID=UPI0018DE771F
MRLVKSRVQNYRSIKDTGEFEIETLKTILVGPNEAGKTVLLKALQQLNRPEGVDGFDIIRDYPRSLYNDITTGKVKPEDVEVVRGYFELDEEDKKLIPTEFTKCQYVLYRKLNNQGVHWLVNSPAKIKFIDIAKDIIRLIAHLDKQFENEANNVNKSKPSESFKDIIESFTDATVFTKENTIQLLKKLEELYPLVDEDNQKEEERYTKLLEQIKLNNKHDEVLKILSYRTPIFVLFNNYFKVKPTIHLEHLAERIERNLLEDDKFYDYGNLCLLKLLGFSARNLADIGKTSSPDKDDVDALKNTEIL